MAPSNGVVTLTVDQGLVALIGLLVLGACGVVAIALGAAVHRWPNGRWFAKRRQQLLRELASWLGGAPANAAAVAQVDRLATQFTVLSGWSLIGMGVGILAAVAAVAGFANITTGTLASLVTNGGALIYAFSFQVISLGVMLGFALGTRLTRHSGTSRQRPSYGDLRRRRPSDYRAAPLGWGLFLVASYSVALCVLMGLRVQRIAIALDGAHWSWSAPLALGALALLAALNPLTATAFVRWAATSPRAMVDDDALGARGADDFRRAQTIGVIQAYAWQSSAWTLLAIADITAQNIQVGVGAPTRTLLEVVVVAMWNVAFLLAGAALLVGTIVTLLRGRLGGRVTGWRRPSAPAAPLDLLPLAAPHLDAPRP